MSSQDSLKATFLLLKNRCIYIHMLNNIFKSISAGHNSNERLDDLYQKTSPILFQTIIPILHEQLVLEIVKLFDPQEIAGRTNLTFRYLKKLLMENNMWAEDLAQIAGEIWKLGSRLEGARNQIIAHADLQVAIENSSLGGMDEEDWDLLIENIYLYVQKLGVILGESSDYKSIGHGPGDMDDLINYLRSGLAFQGSQRSYYPIDFYDWVGEQNLSEVLFRQWQQTLYNG